MRSPPVNGCPPRTGATRPPPCSHRGAAPGDKRGTAGSPPPPLPPLPPQPTDSRRPARGTAALHPPRRSRGKPPPPREGRYTQGGAPLSRYALLYATYSQSAARPLMQYPQQACSPAPARKGTLLAPPGRRHADVSHCSVEGGAMTKRPALVPAWGGRRDEPQQSNLPAPRPAGPPGRAPEEGRRTYHPPRPARLTHQRPVRPRPAPGAAKQPRPSMQQGAMRGATLLVMKGARAGGHRPPPPEEGGEGPRHNPPRSPPSPPPPARGMPETSHGDTRTLPPPRAGGMSPPPRGPRRPGEGGTPLTQYVVRSHAPTRLLPQRLRQARGPPPAHKGATLTTPRINTRARIGAVWRPRPP